MKKFRSFGKIQEFFRFQRNYSNGDEMKIFRSAHGSKFGLFRLSEKKEPSLRFQNNLKKFLKKVSKFRKNSENFFNSTELFQRCRNDDFSTRPCTPHVQGAYRRLSVGWVVWVACRKSMTARVAFIRTSALLAGEYGPSMYRPSGMVQRSMHTRPSS